MNATIGFIDTETTGLVPYYHEIWEVALITDDIHRIEGVENRDWKEQRWFLPVDMGRADPVALRIGGYHERHPLGHNFKKPPQAEPWLTESIVTSIPEFAESFAEWTRGMHLVCAMPSFDIPRLDDLLRRAHQLPEWHYHVQCVESMITGKYGIRPPWRSEDLLKACGIGMPEADKHTALGDARWVRDAYLHCMASGVPYTSTEVSL